MVLAVLFWTSVLCALIDRRQQHSSPIEESSFAMRDSTAEFRLPRCRAVAAATESEICVRIRELEISQFFPKDHKLCERSGLYEHYSGVQVWEGSVVMARWIVLHPEIFVGRRVLELGAGCGLCGIAAAHVAENVVLTDHLSEVLANLRANVEAQDPNLQCKMRVERLDWNQDTADIDIEKADIIIGSEVAYSTSHAAILAKVARSRLVNGGQIYLLGAEDRPGFDQLQQACATLGLACTCEPMAEGVVGALNTMESFFLVRASHRFVANGNASDTASATT